MPTAQPSKQKKKSREDIEKLECTPGGNVKWCSLMENNIMISEGLFFAHIEFVVDSSFLSILVKWCVGPF